MHAAGTVIASIEFRNYKVLRDARIVLGPCNLLIGPNGSGKTSVFHALQGLRGLVARPPVFATTADTGPGGLCFRFAPPWDGL